MATSKPKKPKSLKDLQKIWYEKLEKDGFEDIERNEYRLKVSSNIFSRKTGRSQSSLTPIAQAAKRDYYTMATHFLNTYPFETTLERNIWMYHSEGISRRDIIKILKKVNKKTRLYDQKVWDIIHRLETIMKKLNGVIK